MKPQKLIPLSLFMMVVFAGLGFSAQRVVVCEEMYSEG